MGYAIHATDKFFNYVKPFPCIEPHANTATDSAVPCDSDSLVNVIDLVMGQDGILWVLDLGLSNTLSGYPSKKGDPKIIAFEANSGKVNVRNKNKYYFLLSII